MRPTLWKGVAEMGWLGAAIPEEYGGAGLGYLELVLIAEELGRALAPIPFASSVYLATEAILLAGSEEQKKKYLPRLASGELIGTLALAEGCGRSRRRAGTTARSTAGRSTGEKLPVPDGDVAGFAVVVAKERRGRLARARRPRRRGRHAHARSRSFDPSRSQAKLEFEGAPAERLGAAGQGAELRERRCSTARR